MTQSMHSVTESGTRLEQLRTLALVLADAIDGGDGEHSMAQLARQYRETIAEIHALEETDDDGDDIARLIAKRGSKG